MKTKTSGCVYFIVLGKQRWLMADSTELIWPDRDHLPTCLGKSNVLDNAKRCSSDYVLWFETQTGCYSEVLGQHLKGTWTSNMKILEKENVISSELLKGNKPWNAESSVLTQVNQTVEDLTDRVYIAIVIRLWFYIEKVYENQDLSQKVFVFCIEHPSTITQVLNGNMPAFIKEEPRNKMIKMCPWLGSAKVVESESKDHIVVLMMDCDSKKLKAGAYPRYWYPFFGGLILRNWFSQRVTLLHATPASPEQCYICGSTENIKSCPRCLRVGICRTGCKNTKSVEEQKSKHLKSCNSFFRSYIHQDPRLQLIMFFVI